MSKNLLIHISDIHIRFGSRFEEYTKVLDRIVEESRKLAPRRIIFTGDLFHTKINLSPIGIKTAGEFLLNLSKKCNCPVDIISGNHDANLTAIALQGNSVESVVNLLNNGYIMTKEHNILPTPKEGHGIYFYKDSGIYNVDDELVYRVFSCLDNELPVLPKREVSKKYIDLYHGQIKSGMGSNGYELKGDNLPSVEIFKGSDIALLGDLHSYQVLQEYDEKTHKPAVVYAGSAIQQDFAEELDKGFVVWNLDDFNDFKRVIIPNEVGFFRMRIARGEDIFERLENLQFSLDRKKTKIEIILEDYKENYSVEKLTQIEKYVKSKFGCENVSADMEEIAHDITNNDISIINLDDIDVNNSESAEKLLIEFLTQTECDNTEDVIELSRQIDRELNIKPNINSGQRVDFNSMTVNNLLSFSATNNVFDFDKLLGINGIFGNNYTGKSNFMKLILWIVSAQMMGNPSFDSSKLINMYTGVKKGFGEITFTIAGIKYFFHRGVSLKYKKDGTPEVSYTIEFKKEIQTDEGPKWVDVESEEKATEKTEKKKLILDYLGNYEDLVVTAIQANGFTYLDQKQQAKNSLLNRFVGAEVYADRFEYGNNIFKEIRAKQKVLGNPTEIEAQITELNGQILSENINLESFQKEKNQNNEQIEGFNHEILEHTKKLHKIEIPKETNIDTIQSKINSIIQTKQQDGVVLSEKELWLKQNFKKELSEHLKNLDKTKIEKDIETEKKTFTTEKDSYVKTELWLKSNPIIIITEDQEVTEKKIADNRFLLSELESKLQIALGKKCPTCNSQLKKSDPEVIEKCTKDIEKGKKDLTETQSVLTKIKSDKEHNTKHQNETTKLESLKISLQARKSKLDTLKANLELCPQKEEVTKHNDEVDKQTRIFETTKKLIEQKEKDKTLLEEQIILLKKNKTLLIENEKINKTIFARQEEIKNYKILNLQVDTKIKEVNGNLGAAKNNIEVLTKKLNSIRETDRIYKKYSVYLQAVGRDGIPAIIIRKKLPIINRRINTLLKDMVSFKVELSVKQNGDVCEMFYFDEDKKLDSLPLGVGSGSIKLISSIAISDALYSVSSLTKNSIKIIDESMDALDSNKIHEAHRLFAYLKSKYKNVFIITHRSEIRDFVDNIIEVTKTKDGITDPSILANPEAGISKYIFP
jgi:exonuclease SbcC